MVDTSVLDIKLLEEIKINDHIILLNDRDEATGYLVIGQKKAALIDTMWGRDNLAEVVKKYTDLPAFVINTHGHYDHTFGNAFFDEVYINEKDLQLAMDFYEDDEYVRPKERWNFEPVEFKFTKGGDIFDLGGITLEIIDTPGHTAGSICVLDREEKILFSGDTVIRHCWMMLDECTSLETFYESLQSLQKYEGQFERVYSGHTKTGDGTVLYHDHMAAVKEVMDGIDLEEDHFFMEKCNLIHTYSKGTIKIELVYKNK